MKRALSPTVIALVLLAGCATTTAPPAPVDVPAGWRRPADPAKTAPGQCACGTPDTDSDSDGTVDCNDQCPADPAKTAPGTCGCGVPDTDSDGDGVANCNDGCPSDPTNGRRPAPAAAVSRTPTRGNIVLNHLT